MPFDLLRLCDACERTTAVLSEKSNRSTREKTPIIFLLVLGAVLVFEKPPTTMNDLNYNLKAFLFELAVKSLRLN